MLTRNEVAAGNSALPIRDMHPYILRPIEYGENSFVARPRGRAAHARRGRSRAPRSGLDAERRCDLTYAIRFDARERADPEHAAACRRHRIAVADDLAHQAGSRVRVEARKPEPQCVGREAIKLAAWLPRQPLRHHATACPRARFHLGQREEPFDFRTFL